MYRGLTNIKHSRLLLTCFCPSGCTLLFDRRRPDKTLHLILACFAPLFLLPPLSLRNLHADFDSGPRMLHRRKRLQRRLCLLSSFKSRAES